MGVEDSALDLSMVVPLYNEEENITYLKRTVLEVRRALDRKYRIQLILVDDGSTDATWDTLSQAFEDCIDCQLVRHDQNRGVAAAIMTGIKSASTDVVCSIDCDCSYDPSVLEEMIPLLSKAELVTGSPYHPEGTVFNVPRWRLFLSKSLSRMYCLLLKEKIYTYTSCCRVYRKSFVEKLNVRHEGFLGIAEILIRTTQSFPFDLDDLLVWIVNEAVDCIDFTLHARRHHACGHDLCVAVDDGCACFRACVLEEINILDAWHVGYRTDPVTVDLKHLFDLSNIEIP